MWPHVNMSTLVRDCDCNWSLRFLWGSEFEINSAKSRSVCENAVVVMVAGSQCVFTPLIFLHTIFVQVVFFMCVLLTYECIQ